MACVDNHSRMDLNNKFLKPFAKANGECELDERIQHGNKKTETSGGAEI